MKKKTIFLSVLFVLLSFISNAQQTPHYTQYLYNMQMVNPAFVGVRSDLNISLLSRSQWVGVKGAPSTQTFSINGRTKNGLGIGATVINDKIGLAKSTSVNLDASYTIVTSYEGRLSIGLKGGMSFFSNNLAEGITPDNEFYNSITGNYPNFGIGGYYYNRNFFVGLSMPFMLTSTKFRTTDIDKVGGVSEDLSYYATTGMLFDINEDVKFRPSTLIKYTSKLPLSIDLNTNFLYKELIEAGLSYRLHDSLSAMLAVIIKKKYRIGYAYDYTLTGLGNNLSTHEIVLHIDFDLKRKGRWLFQSSCYF